MNAIARTGVFSLDECCASGLLPGYYKFVKTISVGMQQI